MTSLAASHSALTAVAPSGTIVQLSHVSVASANSTISNVALNSEPIGRQSAVSVSSGKYVLVHNLSTAWVRGGVD